MEHRAITKGSTSFSALSTAFTQPAGEPQQKTDGREDLLQHPASPPPAADQVRSIQRMRLERHKFFSEDLFADPAWNMLLELFASELEQNRVTVTTLCMASGIPTTTALRYISNLVCEGLILRRKDPSDGRRIWVELSQAGSASMTGYFASVQSMSVPI